MSAPTLNERLSPEKFEIAKLILWHIIEVLQLVLLNILKEVPYLTSVSINLESGI